MLDLSAFSILVSIFFISFYVYRHLFPRKGKRYPPGPWGLPLVGHLPFLGSYPPQTFQKWQKTYGDVFRIRMGSWVTVVLNGYSAIKDAMDRKDDVFSSRPQFFSFQVLKKLNDGYDTLPFAPFNPTYIQLRKEHAKALYKFTHTNVQYTEEIVLEEAEILAKDILSKRGQPHYIDEIIQLSVGSITYQIIYGRGHNVREDEAFKISLESANALVKFTGRGNPMDVMQWLRFILPWKASKFWAISEKSANVRFEMVKAHVETFDLNDVRDDLVDMFNAVDLPDITNNKNTLTKQFLLRSVIGLSGAALETTSASMEWLLNYMTAYPDVQKRVQNEIEDVVGSSRRVNLNDKPNLCFTEATILEVLRIVTPTKFALPHYTLSDTKLNGYDIDRDTVVMLNLHSVHHDVGYWGNPEEFKPDRFLTNDKKLDSEKCTRVIPFGLGRRRCVGEHLAKLELFLLFSNVMQRCTFSPADGEPMDLTPIPGLVYHSKHMRVVVNERKYKH